MNKIGDYITASMAKRAPGKLRKRMPVSLSSGGKTQHSRNRRRVADRSKHLTRGQRRYQERRAVGLCSWGGCSAKPLAGHTLCQEHLRASAKTNRKTRWERSSKGLCLHCGKRPQFWGVRCVICRQRMTKHPLPLGARRALRLYREAEQKHAHELIQVDTKLAVRALLASGDVTGKRAKALRLYAGVDDGKWRTYKQVGKLMRISRQWVRKLLHPSQVVLERTLSGKVPWKTVNMEAKQRISNSISIKELTPARRSMSKGSNHRGGRRQMLEI